MTIKWSLDDQDRERIKNARYSVAELQKADHILYDENPTPMQELIESLVTNGEGYLGLQDSLNIVNKSHPKLNLIDVLRKGIAPLSFGETLSIVNETLNPCNEFPIGKYEECKLPHPGPRTLLEQVKSIQYVKGHVPFGAKNFKLPPWEGIHYDRRLSQLSL